MDFITTQDIKKVWDSMGTYNIYIPTESKAVVEAYWKALFQGGNAMYFNMMQYSFLNQLSQAPSVIKFSDQQITVNLQSDQVSSDYLLAPTGLTGSTSYTGTPTTVYSYRVTAINANGETNSSAPCIIFGGSPNLVNHANMLSWNTVYGATGYKIYGRIAGQEKLIATVTNTDYSDTGNISGTDKYPTSNSAISTYIIKLPNEEVIDMSDIVCVTENITLVKEVDFTILDGKYLKIFIPEIFTSIQEILFIQDYMVLNPLISRLFFYTFGGINSIMSLVTLCYPPFIDNFSIKDKADHLLFLIRALFNSMVSGPTMGNLRKTANLFYNAPFSYTAGTVSLTTDSTYNYVTIGTYTYRIPKTLTLAVTDGQTVGQFDLLTQGVTFHDYISNLQLVQTLVNVNNPHEQYFILAVHVPDVIKTLGYYSKFIDLGNPEPVDFFTTNVIPPNLKIVNY